MNLDIQPLKDHSDNRGFSFEIPGSVFAAREPIQHAHMAAVLPGHIRGNHFHIQRHETLLIAWEDSWELGWLEEDGGHLQNRPFQGRGAVSVTIPPRLAHAVKNTGAQPLLLVALSDTDYSPEAPDTVRRIVFPLD